MAEQQRADDGNSYRYHATGLPAGGDAIENETDNRSAVRKADKSPSRAVVAGDALPLCGNCISQTAATINHDRMIYFCLVRYKSGLAWAERDPANMSRRDTIADIMTGDLENIVTILECNPVEHVCSDVTEDVLAEAGVLLGIGMDHVEWDRDPERDQFADQIEWDRDHARDQRKHERVG